MDDSTRAQIIIAAISAAGTPQVDQFDNESAEDYAARAAKAAVDYQNRIASNATMFTAMISERSAISRLIESVEVSKVFTTTIIGVQKERSSTRGIITMKGAPTKFHEDGVETARTDRTDNPIGRAMAIKLKSLIGHKVTIWIEVEEVAGGTNKVRVVRHVEDMGVDERFGSEVDGRGNLVELRPAS